MEDTTQNSMEQTITCYVTEATIQSIKRRESDSTETTDHMSKEPQCNLSKKQKELQYTQPQEQKDKPIKEAAAQSINKVKEAEAVTPSITGLFYHQCCIAINQENPKLQHLISRTLQYKSINYRSHSIINYENQKL